VFIFSNYFFVTQNLTSNISKFQKKTFCYCYIYCRKISCWFAWKWTWKNI